MNEKTPIQIAEAKDKSAPELAEWEASSNRAGKEVLNPAGIKAYAEQTTSVASNLLKIFP